MRRNPTMHVAEVEAFLEAEFPQLRHGGRMVSVESVGPMTARLRLHSDERHLRPGRRVGTGDVHARRCGIYVAILAQIGPIALAVTTNLNINFLRKPPHGDVIAEISLLKLGKRLAVGEATLFAEGDDEPVAHAVGTYSIPPR